jgi:tetratricopeptide (TPR) repeat protein
MPGKQSVDHQIRAALDLAMTDDIDARNAAVANLRALQNTLGLGAGLRGKIDTALVQALQKVGDYQGALAILDTIALPKKPLDAAMHDYWRARSLERLGHFENAVLAFERVMPSLRAHAPDFYHYHLIEAGRAYSMAGRSAEAIAAWQESAAVFEARDDNQEHLLRARANIGMELLKSDDPDQVAEGERILYETADGKALVGDAEGLTNNYSALSLHYAREGRWERAIAFARRDLKLTRLIGDEHQLCATLGNMATIYIRTLQLSAARRCLEEARAIGERLGQKHTLDMVAGNLAAAQAVARDASARGVPVGARTPCACGSGEMFKDCCGRADFEPDTPLINFDETPNSEGLTFRNMRPRDEHGRLDMMLSPGIKDRFSWTTVEGHDGWVSIAELPDVATYHLKAARNLSAAARDTMRFDEPLAACLLSVCGAEAFINTLTFFIADTAQASAAHPTSLLGKAATLVGDPLSYQRATELTLKWAAIGEALAGPNWIQPERWRAFTVLVSIRNELVHFKAANFEQVSPAPNHLHEILRRLPPEVELRQVPHSWPARLLTASFARWCVETTDGVIDMLKAGYAEETRRPESA